MLHKKISYVIINIVVETAVEDRPLKTEHTAKRIKEINIISSMNFYF